MTPIKKIHPFKKFDFFFVYKTSGYIIRYKLKLKYRHVLTQENYPFKITRYSSKAMLSTNCKYCGLEILCYLKTFFKLFL